MNRSFSHPKLINLLSSQNTWKWQSLSIIILLYFITLLLLQSYMLFLIDFLFVAVTHNIRFAIKQYQMSQCLQKKM